jgi:hypothetical protein
MGDIYSSMRQNRIEIEETKNAHKELLKKIDISNDKLDILINLLNQLMSKENIVTIIEKNDCNKQNIIKPKIEQLDIEDKEYIPNITVKGNVNSSKSEKSQKSGASLNEALDKLNKMGK